MAKKNVATKKTPKAVEPEPVETETEAEGTEEVELDIVDDLPASERSNAFKVWLNAVKQVPGKWVRRVYKSASAASGARLGAIKRGYVDEEWKGQTKGAALYLAFDPDDTLKGRVCVITERAEK